MLTVHSRKVESEFRGISKYILLIVMLQFISFNLNAIERKDIKVYFDANENGTHYQVIRSLKKGWRLPDGNYTVNAKVKLKSENIVTYQKKLEYKQSNFNIDKQLGDKSLSVDKPLVHTLALSRVGKVKDTSLVNKINVIFKSPISESSRFKITIPLRNNRNIILTNLESDSDLGKSFSFDKMHRKNASLSYYLKRKIACDDDTWRFKRDNARNIVQKCMKENLSTISSINFYGPANKHIDLINLVVGGAGVFDRDKVISWVRPSDIPQVHNENLYYFDLHEVKKRQGENIYLKEIVVHYRIDNNSSRLPLNSMYFRYDSNDRVLHVNELLSRNVKSKKIVFDFLEPHSQANELRVSDFTNGGSVYFADNAFSSNSVKVVEIFNGITSEASRINKLKSIVSKIDAINKTPLFILGGKSSYIDSSISKKIITNKNLSDYINLENISANNIVYNSKWDFSVNPYLEVVNLSLVYNGEIKTNLIKRSDIKYENFLSNKNGAIDEYSELIFIIWVVVISLLISPIYMIARHFLSNTQGVVSGRELGFSKNIQFVLRYKLLSVIGPIILLMLSAYAYYIGSSLSGLGVVNYYLAIGSLLFTLSFIKIVRFIFGVYYRFNDGDITLLYNYRKIYAVSFIIILIFALLFYLSDQLFIFMRYSTSSAPSFLTVSFFLWLLRAPSSLNALWASDIFT